MLASSELLLGTSAARWGAGRGDRAGRGQKAGPQEKEVPLARVPGWGAKLLMLYSGKQGLTVPHEPSPAESRLGTAPEGFRAQNTQSASTVQVAAASWGPAGPRISARALLRASAGRKWSRCPWKAELALPWQPRARRPGFPPHRESHLRSLSALDLSLPQCKRNRLCVMILKDTPVLASFLRGLEH